MGYSFPVDDETRLMRFLILGSEGGSYYASERKFTLDNVASVKRFIESNGVRAVEIIADVSANRRAPKVTPVIYCFALAISYGNDETRKAAYAQFFNVIRTASHLQELVSYLDNLRGWGPALRRAVASWYSSMSIRDAVYQTVKYRERNEWTHTDILRSCHPKEHGTQHDQLFAWITKGTMPPTDEPCFDLIHAFEQGKTITDPKELASLIRNKRMTREMVMPEMMTHKEIWDALAEDMPITALVRNLATMTRVGTIAPMNSAWVVERLNEIGTDKGKIHPIGVLSALLTYKNGKGARGDNTW